MRKIGMRMALPIYKVFDADGNYIGFFNDNEFEMAKRYVETYGGRIVKSKVSRTV